MTPAKEKAKKLVNEFYQPLGLLHCNVSSNTMWEHAKQCALIAVEEMEQTFLRCVGSQKHMWTESELDHYKELQQTKTEINLL